MDIGYVRVPHGRGELVGSDGARVVCVDLDEHVAQLGELGGRRREGDHLEGELLEVVGLTIRLQQQQQSSR